MATDHFGKEDCEGMNLTPDELKRLGSALKDKRFRELLFEYAEELNDPANRRQYEEDIIALEKERGINAIFIHPKAGYVLKTTSGSTKQTKVFLNMCENENVNKPSCYRSMRDNKIKGLQWNIPHLLAPSRKDVDKRGNSCMVYDVVFNPDTLYMAQKNKNFRTMIQEIAMKSVEDKFSVHLDQQNLHYPKMKYKGQPVPTIIRNKHEFVEASGNNKSDSPALCLKSIQSLASSGNESEAKDTSVILNSCGSDTMDLDEKTVKNNIKLNVENSSSCSMPYTKMENILDNMHFADVNKEKNSSLVPKYSILYRNYRDLEDYSIIPGKLMSTQPKEIIITVELPLLNSTDDIELDVMKDSITLKSKKSGPQYHLQLQLPHSIDEEKGSAKFDRTKHNLIITLIVLQSDEYFSLTEDSNLNLVKDSTDYWHGEGECDSNLNSMNMSDFPCGINLDDIHQCQDKHSGKEEQCSLILHEEERGNSFEEYCVKDANEGHNCGLISKSSCTYLYTVPDFEYHQTSDMLILIIYVKNVEPQSIRTQCCQECCIWQMTFSTLGTGFVPFHYSLVLSFEDPCLAFDVEDESSVIDVNDNTVLWKLKKSQMLHGMWTYFFAGVDQQNLKKYYMASEIGTLARLKSLKDVTEDILCTSEVLDGSKVSIIDVTEKVVTFDIQVGPEINENKCETHLDSTNTNSYDSDQYKNGSVYNTEILSTLSDEVKQIAKDEIRDDPVDSLCSLKTIKSTQKIRTSSESSEDQSPIRRRGILKYSDKSCRTVSESSDDFLWSSQDISSSDFDFLVDSSTDKIKKSVRFSDYVSKNVYRVNSSILGQRKKNQRKALNKQRARSRKDSMSSSDSECMDPGDKDNGKGTKMEDTTKRSISDTDLFDERIVCAENKGKQKCETQNVESCISETFHSVVDPSGVEDEVEDETTKDLIDKKCVSVDGFFDQEVFDSTSFHITNHEDWTVVTRKKRNGRRRNSNEAKDYDIGNIYNKETFNLTSSQRNSNDVRNTATADEKNLQNFCADNGGDREENISDEKNNVESHVDGAEGRDYILNDSTDRKQSSCSIEHLEDKQLDSQVTGNQDHKYYKCTPTNSLVEDNYCIKYTEDVSSSSDIECNQLKSCPIVKDEEKTMFTEEIKNMVSSENHENIHVTDDNDTGDDCYISCVPSEPTVCDITKSSVLPICENRTVTDEAIQEEEDVTVGSETILKWNVNSSEICSYSTHCNIQFSNNLMYQLD